MYLLTYLWIQKVQLPDVYVYVCPGTALALRIYNCIESRTPRAVGRLYCVVWMQNTQLLQVQDSRTKLKSSDFRSPYEPLGPHYRDAPPFSLRCRVLHRTDDHGQPTEA